MADGYGVVLARRARAELEALERHRRGRLTMELTRLAAREPADGLLAMRSWLHLAACEVFAKRRLVLVYAILDRWALQAELFGPELDRTFRDRAADRFMHGRRQLS